MTIFYLQAYNAESTICRAINSILNQTDRNFRLYVVDNGSTDKTRSLIMECSAKDERVIPFTRDINHMLEADQTHPIYSYLNSLCSDDSGADYFATLDADDEYAPDFLEKMIPFMEENDLDVAACGNDQIDTVTGDLIHVNVIDKHLILEGDLFERHFQQSYPFMWTVWGKVYRTSLLRRCTFDYRSEIEYGSDTVFAMETFRHAGRAGILAESLHKYYKNDPNAVSYQFDPKRIASTRMIYESAKELLLEKTGHISRESASFLLRVYYSTHKAALKSEMNADIPVSKKVQSIWEVFTNKTTREIFYNRRVLIMIIKKFPRKAARKIKRLTKQKMHMER